VVKVSFRRLRTFRRTRLCRRSAARNGLMHCNKIGWKNPSVYLLPCLTSYAGNLRGIRSHPKIRLSRNGADHH
jgi:hypothetical protein